MALKHPLKVGTRVFFEIPPEEPDFEFDSEGREGLSGRGRILKVTKEGKNSEVFYVYIVTILDCNGEEQDNFPIGSEIGLIDSDIKRVLEP